MKKQNPMEKAEKEIADNLPKGMIGEDTEDVGDAPAAEMELEEESTDARRE